MPLKTNFISVIQNTKGQGMIESLAFALALSATLSCLGALVYFGFVHIGVNYLLHEFLVCQSTQGENQCRRDFLRKAKPVVFAGKVLNFESSKFNQTQKARVVLQMPMSRTLSLKKELRIYR